IVGSYTQAWNKTLLIGHASTVFADLNLVTVGETVKYDGKEYVISEIALFQKEAVEMDKVLAGAEKDTIIIMTCAGELYGTDASHRLIVTAVVK
ncbi:sortase, partial [Candidatus Saccharibacteria bacterium]|nr:sortase [Candidatus Saccharibacteria bacterium]